MLLTRPCHSPDFMDKYHIGVETHIFRTDNQPDFEQYIPYIHGVHLPYANLNLAAYDEDLRNRSIIRIKEAIDEACKYPVTELVMHPTGYEVTPEKIIGCYDLMIPSIQEIADYAAGKNKIICLENQVMREHWKHRSYGYCASEWFRIHRDVQRPNVMLTLDTSHAATSVAVYDSLADRRKHIFDFLEYKALIGRIHWSDSVLAENTSKFNDMHLVPGRGDLPKEFHQEIKKISCVKTLEQRVSDEEHIFSFEFIESL